MTATRVRPAVLTDAPAIARIGAETWPNTYAFAGKDYVAHGLSTWWSEEAVREGIEATRTFVAEIYGAVIGMGNIDFRPERPIIWKLYVLPGRQGAGAGHALITRLLAEAGDGREVLLEYTDRNEDAATFYRRHGFVELRRDRAETPGWPDQMWMVHRAPMAAAGGSPGAKTTGVS